MDILSYRYSNSYVDVDPFRHLYDVRSGIISQMVHRVLAYLSGGIEKILGKDENAKDDTFPGQDHDSKFETGQRVQHIILLYSGRLIERDSYKWWSYLYYLLSSNVLGRTINDPPRKILTRNDFKYEQCTSCKRHRNADIHPCTRRVQGPLRHNRGRIGVPGSVESGPQSVHGYDLAFREAVHASIIRVDVCRLD
jgi:hypothetical protein